MLILSLYTVAILLIGQMTIGDKTVGARIHHQAGMGWDFAKDQLGETSVFQKIEASVTSAWQSIVGEQKKPTSRAKPIFDFSNPHKLESQEETTARADVRELLN